MKNRRQTGTSVEEHFRKKMADAKFRRLYEKESRKVHLGFVLNKMRNQAGLTQAELAVKAGVTQGYIAQLETAEMRNYEINTLKKIAEALHKVLVIGFADESKPAKPVQPKELKELVTC